MTIGGAIGVGGGGGAGVGVVGAGAYSTNTIANDVEADVTGGSTVTSHGGGITMSATDNSMIVANGGGVGISVGGGGGAGVGVTLGISAATNKIQNIIYAEIDGSTASATGSVSLSTQETANIQALSIGGALAVGGGGGAGVGVGLAGAGSSNTIADTVESVIQDNASVTTAAAASVSLTATDNPSITANGGGVGIAVGVGGGVGVGVSLGVAYASNQVEDTVEALITGSTVIAAGAISLSATETANIQTLSIGGGVALGGGVVGISLSVAGSVTVNTIANQVEAYVAGSNITASGGSVTIVATDGSSITANSGGLGIGVGGGIVGAALAVGFATAQNQVNNLVLAYGADSDITAVGANIAFSAIENATIQSLSVGGAVALAVGGVAADGAGAGASSTNTIGNTVEAYITDGSTVTTQSSGNVSLTASDAADINVQATGASLSIEASFTGGSISVGAATANNTVDDLVEAYSSGSAITSAGDIDIKAMGNSTVTADSSAATLSVAISLAGLSFGGGGVTSTNMVGNTIQADIQGTNSAITAAGNVTVTASQTTSIDAENNAEAIVAGLSGGSVGYSSAQATDDSAITADIGGAVVNASNITISATTTDTGTANNNVTSWAITIVGGSDVTGDSSVNVSPTVQAFAGAGASLTAANDFSITASSATSASSAISGDAGGPLAVGTTSAEGTVGGSTSTSVAAGAALTATAGNLLLTAGSKQLVTTSSNGTAGGFGAGGKTTSTATVQNSVSASVGDNASLTAGQNITISSTNNTINDFGFSTNSSNGFIAAGNPTSSTIDNDQSNASLGQNVTAMATQGNFTLEAISQDDGVEADADASGGGAVKSATATATTTLTDPATATVGAGSTITANLGTLLVLSQTGTGASASASASGGGLGVNSTATANTTVTSNAETDIDQGAALHGLNVTIEATGGAVRSVQANADASSSALGVSTSATTAVTATYNSTVSIATGADIFGADLVRLASASGDVSVFSVAGGYSYAAGGDTDSSASSLLNERVLVTTAAGSTIEAGTLSVAADLSAPLGFTAANRVAALVDTGSANQLPLVVPSSQIDFNSNVTLLGAGDVLQIAPDGSVINQSGISLVPSSTQVQLKPINNISTGVVELTTTGVFQNISGHASFAASPSVAAVDIINESPEDLVIPGIQVINQNPSKPTVQVDSTGAQDFTYSTSIVGPYATQINISNTGGSRTLLTGDIDNPVGTSTISDANASQTKGGSIVASGDDQSIQTGELTLASATGSIGSSSAPLNAQLVESSPGSPSFQATAPQGDVYLDLSTLNQTTAALAVTSAALTGRFVNLQIADGISQPAGQAAVPEGSSYDLAGVAASQLDVRAGTRTAIALSITGPGDLDIGTITSPKGNVTLTAGGSIADTTGDTQTNVKGATITLDAGGAIGSAADPFEIESAYSGPGLVNASASQGITLDQTAGNLNVGMIDSGGLVSLTASGAIVDGDAASTIALSTSVGAVLVAGSGIGTLADPLQTEISSLAAAAGKAALWINNTGDLTIGGTAPVLGVSALGVVNVSTSGNLSVDENISAGGDITLIAGGDITVAPHVLVSSSSGNDTLDSEHGNITVPGQSDLAAATTLSLEAMSPSASTSDLTGSIQASSLSVTTGNGDDVVDIEHMPIGLPIFVEGGGDTALNLSSISGNDVFTITGTAVVVQSGNLSETINYVGVQLLTVNDAAFTQGDNDTFDVLSTTAATTLDAGPGAAVVNLYASTDSLGSPALNAPVTFQGGAGAVSINVFGPAAGDNAIVLAGAGDANGRLTSALVGDGLQCQYSAPATLLGATATSVGVIFSSGGGLSDIYVLGTLFDTTVQTGAGADLVSLGGYGPGVLVGPAIPILDESALSSVAMVTQTITQEIGASFDPANSTLTVPAEETFGDFKQPITIAGGSTKTTLAIDDSLDTSQYDLLLTPTSLLGIPSEGVNTVPFTGIGAMTVDLGSGGGLFTVQDTFAGPGPITIDTGTGLATVLVQSSSSPLVIDGSKATSGENTITFDAASDTQPMTDAALADSTATAYPGYAALTGFGPIDTVEFTGFGQANLNLGQNLNTLTINLDILNLSVNTDQQVMSPTGGVIADDSKNQGDDFITIDQIGYSKVSGAVDQINGGSGQDLVTVVIPGSPIPQGPDYLTELDLTSVATLTVKNATSSTGVGWIVANGYLSAEVPATGGAPVKLLGIDGAASVMIVGGTCTNTLSVQSLSGSAQGTIDGDNVTLVSGQEVLQQTNYDTYYNDSDTSALVTFGGVPSGGATSYTDYLTPSGGFTPGFTLTSSGGMLEPSATYPGAVGASSSTGVLFTLTAADGGIFALSEISLSSAGGTSAPVTFTGTTANGNTVSALLPGVSTSGFEIFRFPSYFTALTSVSWNPGNTLATNIVATEQLEALTAGPLPTSVPGPWTTATDPIGSPGDPLSVEFTTGSPGVIPFISVKDTVTGRVAIINDGANFNGARVAIQSVDPDGTPDAKGSVTQFEFDGNLVFPAGSTVIAMGQNALSLFASNDVIAANVTFTFSPGELGGGTGGVRSSSPAREAPRLKTAVPAVQPAAAAQAALFLTMGTTAVTELLGPAARPVCPAAPVPRAVRAAMG